MIVTSIAPWLQVHNSVNAVEFYKTGFGAVETYHLDIPDGTVVARLAINGAEFWLSEESRQLETNPIDTDSGAIRMILTVPDPDSLFSRALEAGATQVYAVGEGHGWRIGRLVDPFGHHREIGHPLDEN